MVVSVYGYQRPYMVTSGFYGYHGCQWLSAVSYAYQRLCMVASGFYGYHGYQWFPMVTIACAWSPVVFMVISGYAWLSVVICIVISDCMHGICGYMHGYQWLYAWCFTGKN